MIYYYCFLILQQWGVLMKKFFAFTLIILFFTIFCIYCTEKTDVLHLAELPMDISFDETDGRLLLSWQRLPYPCFYEVETYSHTTGEVENEPAYHLLKKEFTFQSSYEAPTSAIPVAYRVSAYGMFGRLNGPTPYLENPDYPEPLHPLSIYHYTEEHPASVMPFLVWHNVPNAVCYELEFLSAPPEEEGGISLSQQHHLFSTQQIFTNGYQADLTQFLAVRNIYWRVRALNLQKEPIGVFSPAERLYVNPTMPLPDKPLLNDFDAMPDFKQPLYPVYHWIPLHNVQKYEVELLEKAPEMENSTIPSEKVLWRHSTDDVCSCYDEYARSAAGEYYWRVRGLDANGQAIGRYSDTAKFTITSPTTRPLAAAYGDSITHGGGALSYSPASLEYSYTTYLDFPALNLGKSGDTSHDSLLRFEHDVLPFQPYNLLILTGSNSLRADNITADDIISDLAALQQKCQKNYIRPILLTLMPLNTDNIFTAFHTETDPLWRQKMDAVNSYIRQQPYYIDLEPYFYAPNKEAMATVYATDGLHPDIRGKMLMAEIINQSAFLLKK